MIILFGVVVVSIIVPGVFRLAEELGRYDWFKKLINKMYGEL